MLSTLLYMHTMTAPEVAVLLAKNTGGVLDPQRPLILVLNSLFCMHNTTGEGGNNYSLFILVLFTLLCMLKTTDEVCDPYKLVSLVLKSLFCTHKTTDEGWKLYRLVILVQSRCFACTKPLMIAGTHIDLSF